MSVIIFGIQIAIGFTLAGFILPLGFFLFMTVCKALKCAWESFLENTK